MATCHTRQVLFETHEDAVQILLTLKKLFTQDFEVQDVLCGAPSESEPSLLSATIFSAGGYSRVVFVCVCVSVNCTLATNKKGNPPTVKFLKAWAPKIFTVIVLKGNSSLVRKIIISSKRCRLSGKQCRPK